MALLPALLGRQVAGLATLWLAIAADMGASLLLIGNGLRLLRGKVVPFRRSQVARGRGTPR